MRSFIDRHQMQEYEKTIQALKRKEKIGLKLELEIGAETKVFLTFTVFCFFILL